MLGKKQCREKWIILGEGTSSCVIKDQSHNINKYIILVVIDWVWWQVSLIYSGFGLKHSCLPLWEGWWTVEVCVLLGGYLGEPPFSATFGTDMSSDNPGGWGCRSCVLTWAPAWAPGWHTTADMMWHTHTPTHRGRGRGRGRERVSQGRFIQYLMSEVLVDGCSLLSRWSKHLPLKKNVS